MSNFNLAIGSATPRNWRAELGIRLGEHSQEERFKSLARKTVFHPAFEQFIGFLAMQAIRSPEDGGASNTILPESQLRAWPVRDQGRRATCTAFAVVAAEEAWRMAHMPDVTLPDLSEEFLYAKAREFTFQAAGVNLKDAEVDALTLSGATFLKQAQLALEAYGSAAEALEPYQRDAGVSTRISPQSEAVINAETMKLGSPFVHNIVDSDGHLIGENRGWKTRLEQGEDDDARVSDIIIAALERRCPVAAAFAVLNGQGRGAWLGATPFLTGQVTYPSDDAVRGLRPIGGHAVCILGFVADEAAQTGNDGWFIFRNSLGSHRFGRDAKDGASPPRSFLPGYGLISSKDLDRYCWEYLYREPPGMV